MIIEASGATHAPAALASVKKGGRVLVGLQGAPSKLDLLYATVNEIEILTTLAHVRKATFRKRSRCCVTHRSAS